MKRLLCLAALTLALIIPGTTPTCVEAQTLRIGRGGVHYNGYGQGYYGGYGRGYRGYGSRNRGYSGYGYGPYGYGHSPVFQTYSTNGYGYSAVPYYTSYGDSAIVGQYYAPTYNPYGYGGYSAYGNY